MKEFDGGAKRSELLPPFEDIPYEALEAIALRFGMGEPKYGRFNWKNGGPEFFRQAKSHAIRHLYLYANDNESTESNLENLTAAAWGTVICLWWEKVGKQLWDKAHKSSKRI